MCGKNNSIKQLDYELKISNAWYIVLEGQAQID